MIRTSKQLFVQFGLSLHEINEALALYDESLQGTIVPVEDYLKEHDYDGLALIADRDSIRDIVSKAGADYVYLNREHLIDALTDDEGICEDKQAYDRLADLCDELAWSYPVEVGYYGRETVKVATSKGLIPANVDVVAQSVTFAGRTLYVELINDNDDAIITDEHSNVVARYSDYDELPTWGESLNDILEDVVYFFTE